MPKTTQTAMAQAILTNHPQLAARVCAQLAAGSLLPCDCSKCRHSKAPRLLERAIVEGNCKVVVR